ncbi:MAG: C1 family peptidase [Phycisphaeraceae bacterium]|nr:C1 family peptidase [Phycisphaerales bacterium]MCB9858824.1 C1 family peptidase [Phycisphaeraceae bacterium]
MAHAAEPGYVGLGWLPDVPDARDHSKEELDQELKSQLGRKASGKAVSKAMAALRMRGSDGSNGSGGSGAAVTAPPWIDLRLSGWLSPIEDQESLGSCTANAVVSMLEAVRRRLTGEHEDLSRLFLYKITRKLLGWDGDTGAFIRETIKATRTHGVPPEERWPYVISRFDEEPDAFLYSFAANYKATLYARLDLYSNTAWQNLDALRSTLAEGNPVAFGFPVYDSINRPINWQGEVPYPQPGDKQVGGHAVLAVGYDDKIKIAGSKLDDSKGAIIFQNSWGEEWGDDGFGYLPYDYFLEGLAMDLWTVTSAEWIDTSKFA